LHRVQRKIDFGAGVAFEEGRPAAHFLKLHAAGRLLRFARNDKAGGAMTAHCHCEERSDEAISNQNYKYRWHLCAPWEIASLCSQ